MKDELSDIVTHVTRVNSKSRASKMILYKAIVKYLDLNWEDDYLCWELTGGKNSSSVLLVFDNSCQYYNIHETYSIPS